MVKGIPQLRARLAAIAPKLDDLMRPELERIATDLVRQMDSIKPLPNIKIAWTWGKPPFRSIGFGSVRANRTGPRITIYATASASSRSGGLPAIAAWWEFGTAERYRKARGLKKTARNQVRMGIVGQAGYTGKIEARPYFFPVYRANKARIRSRIRTAINREIRKM